MRTLLIALSVLSSGVAFSAEDGQSRTGVDDFKVLSTSGKIVDKTLFIQDWINANNLVTLVTRPRRWGKSTTLSMAWRFFALEKDRAEAAANRQLFEKRKIRNTRIFEQYQGQCPSIFMSFKNVGGGNVGGFLESLRSEVARAFRRSKHLADWLEDTSSDQSKSSLDRQYAVLDLQKFSHISLNGGKDASEAEFSESLKFLSDLLYQHHGKKKVCAFIDEYDAPLHEAFENDYLKTAIDTIHRLLSPLLKSNSNLERALLTGILRMATEDLTAGLNNIVEDNVFSGIFGPHYGFTEPEVEELFKHFNKTFDLDKVKNTCNGYKFFDGSSNETGPHLVEIYNPWSVTQYLKNNGPSVNSWANTGSTGLLRPLVTRPEVQTSLASLRKGETISLTIPGRVSFEDIANNKSTALWPLLLYSGYLAFQSKPEYYPDENAYRATVKVPNTELMSVYNNFYDLWLLSCKLPRSAGIDRFKILFGAIFKQNYNNVSKWLEKESSLTEPIDFTEEQWAINPLQLAALVNSTDIFNSLGAYYPNLFNVTDSEKLSVADYAFLGGLKPESSLKRSKFDDPLPWLEPLCWANGWPLLFASTALSTGLPYLLGAYFMETFRLPKVSALATLITIATTCYKDSVKSLLNICGRYDNYYEKSPETFSTLKEFGEYRVRNPDSYVSLKGCKPSDSEISKFEKDPTTVKFVTTDPVTFSLCQKMSPSSRDEG